MSKRISSMGSSLYSEDSQFLKKYEISMMKRQMEVLAGFLPNEVLAICRNDFRGLKNFVGVCLTVNLGGFNTITEKFFKFGKAGLHKMSTILNSFVGAIIEVCTFYGGDVLKITGAGILVLWKITSEDNLAETLHEAVVCTFVLHQVVAKYQQDLNIEFQLKTVITCGNCTFSLIGDENKLYYVLVSDSLNDAVRVQSCSSSNGKIVVSAHAWTHMLQERYEISNLDVEYVRIVKVLYTPNDQSRKNAYDEKYFRVLQLIDIHYNQSSKKSSETKQTYESQENEKLQQQMFIKSLPPRDMLQEAPRRWLLDHLRAFIIAPVIYQVDDGQPVEYSTELRFVTVQYFHIILQPMSDNAEARMIDSIYRCVCQIVSSRQGLINKLWRFQQDIMIDCIYGVRTLDHDVEAQNSLKAATKIQHQLQSWEEVVSVSVSMCNGLVFSGVVGHPNRKEFIIIGLPVKRAQIWSWEHHGKITCDLRTYKCSKLASFRFKLLTKLGRGEEIDDSNAVFEYAEDLKKLKKVRLMLVQKQAEEQRDEVDRKRNEVDENIRIITTDHLMKRDLEAERTPYLLGRDGELAEIERVIKSEGMHGICLYGIGGIGKTAILRHVMHQLNEQGHFLIANLELAHPAGFIPFYSVIRIYKQIYDARCEIDTGEDHDNESAKEEFPDVPRDLTETYREMNYKHEDLALQKYRMLNFFRNLIAFANTEYKVIIVIDNFENVDQLSWDILELILEERSVRMLLAANFSSEPTHSMRFHLALNHQLHMLEITRVSDKVVPAMVCHFADCAAIPEPLLELIAGPTEGVPSYIQTCLLYLLNTGVAEMTYFNLKCGIPSGYIFANEKYHNNHIVPLVVMSSGKKSNDGLNLVTIALDLFDSLSQYLQLVIKTASILGDTFTRNLLYVAMKYPADDLFNECIQELYEQGIFDCGSRFIYEKTSGSMSSAATCCKCYFEPEFFERPDNQDFPPYAYCKILHFRNKSIRDIAYDLMPASQRRELHLVCTNVIENVNHQCPYCMRHPRSSPVVYYRYKEIMSYLNDTKRTTDFEGVSDTSKEECKQAIRQAFAEARAGKTSNQAGERGEGDANQANELQLYAEYAVFDRTMCKCTEIYAYVFKDLIFHSDQSGHVSKQMFFLMQYGTMLLHLHDFNSAQNFLVQARELSLFSAGMRDASCSPVFRKYHVGKIELGLAKACLEMHQLNQAAAHLAIAIRQYDIPSVSLVYKPYLMLLIRKRLGRIKTYRPFVYKNNVVRLDLGTCMAYVARLFFLKGNEKIARYCANYSLYLLQTVNPNTRILYQGFGTTLELYRVITDTHTLEQLIKCALRQIQLNYTGDVLNNVDGIIVLMDMTFYLAAASGKICEAINIGFRCLDFNLKVNANYVTVRMLNLLSLLLVYNFRLKDAGDVCKLLIQINEMGERSQIEYLIAILIFYVQSGFYIEKLSEIKAKYEHIVMSSMETSDFNHTFIQVLINLSLLKLEKTPIYAISVKPTKALVKAFNGMRLCLFYLEMVLYMHSRGISINGTTAVRDNDIKYCLKLLEKEAKTQYKICIPKVYILKAWYVHKKGGKSAVKKILNKAIKECDKQGNVLLKCFIIQQKNAWNTGVVRDIRGRPDMNYQQARIFSWAEWIQFSQTYP